LIEICSPFKQGLEIWEAGKLHELDRACANVFSTIEEPFDCALESMNDADDIENKQCLTNYVLYLTSGTEAGWVLCGHLPAQIF
jgi:hypothetical protein